MQRAIDLFLTASECSSVMTCEAAAALLDSLDKTPSGRAQNAGFQQTLLNAATIKADYLDVVDFICLYNRFNLENVHRDGMELSKTIKRLGVGRIPLNSLQQAMQDCGIDVKQQELRDFFKRVLKYERDDVSAEEIAVAFQMLGL